MSVHCLWPKNGVFGDWWFGWLQKIPEVRGKSKEWNDDFLRYGEVSSVSILSNAASVAGYASIMEYPTNKRRHSRGRPYSAGRADLWIGSPCGTQSSSFEMKQCFVASDTKQTTIIRKLTSAIQDAGRIDDKEANSRYGCLIVVPYDSVDMKTITKAIDNMCINACQSAFYKNPSKSKNTSYGFRIDGGDRPIWLLFKKP